MQSRNRRRRAGVTVCAAIEVAEARLLLTGVTPGGGDDDKGDAPIVELKNGDNTALEGPYSGSGYDRGSVVLTVTNAAGGPDLVTVHLRLEGDASPEDFELRDQFGHPLPAGGDGVYTIPNTSGEVLQVIALVDDEFELPETVRLAVTGVEGGVPGDSRVGEVVITDAQLDLQILDAVSDGFLDSSSENIPGARLVANTQFSFPYREGETDWAVYGELAGDGEFEYLSHLLAEDPELYELQVTDHFQHSVDDFSNDHERLVYFDGVVPGQRIWAAGEKGFRLYSSSESLDFQKRYYLEVANGRPAPYSLAIKYASVLGDLHVPTTVADGIRITTWDADVDIDSDNTRRIAQQVPQLSVWEEVLEDHEYGIGKIVYPSAREPGAGFSVDPWGLTTVIPHLGEYPEEGGISFDYPFLSGESGSVRLLIGSTQRGWMELSPGEVYSIAELSNRFGSGAQVKIDAISANTRHSTRVGADVGRPDDRIRLTLHARADTEAAWVPVTSDEVKYLVVEPSENDNQQVLYPHLQWNLGKIPAVAMRDSLISEAVYNAETLPQFGLKLLNTSEMVALGISLSLAEEIANTQWPSSSGLKVALYRDFLSSGGRRVIMAFAGTELTDLNDIRDDLLQAVGRSTGLMDSHDIQHIAAMRMGVDFAAQVERKGFADGNFSGHSLGGSLASAASVATGGELPANVFNAAGLHRNTVTARDAQGNIIPDAPRYLNSLKTYDKEKSADGVITNYRTEYDILSFVQEHMAPMWYGIEIPAAVGRQQVLVIPKTHVLRDYASELARKLSNHPFQGAVPGDVGELLREFGEWLEGLFDHRPELLEMLRQHQMRAVQYGMMVYHDPLTDEKTWDIFGEKY